jgi:hypothetical protein
MEVRFGANPEGRRRRANGRECAHSHAGGVCFDREERHAAMRAADIDGIGHAPQLDHGPCALPASTGNPASTGDIGIVSRSVKPRLTGPLPT